ncbi:dTDP-6-deoxy-L-hexose 3-O-methyltransferase [Escherichia coli]|nr:dTDP-6-deoxy-L-hexose 3-O-methyltransferase [Escherichia coli]
MNAITKERIELFIKNPLENGLTRSEQMEVARIALASLEAEPVVYMWDSERKDIDAPGYYRAEHLVFAESSVKQWGGRVVPLYTAPPATVVPEFETWFNSQESGRSICSTQIRRSLQEISWNACRAAMLHAGNFREISETSTNSPVTPTLLPGGFTVEDAKELHEDLVRSHISQALSGEKMKKKDRDADLRWIHGVIVQAAWFVKASLEALPEPPQEVNQ